jgi:biopolymer transport protein ExbB/TolQ
MVGETSLFEVIRQGGFFMGMVWILLLVGSIVSWAVALERFLKFRAAQAGSARLTERVCKLVKAGNLNEARGLAQNAEGIVGQLLAAGLAQPGKDRGFFEERLVRAAGLLLENLESRLPLLATIGSIAPFVGLFGTVLGIIRAFRHLGAQAEAAGAAAVSAGIAEALIATAAGLGVAIVAVLFYNFYQNRLQRIESLLQRTASELSEAFYDRK